MTPKEAIEQVCALPLKNTNDNRLWIERYKVVKIIEGLTHDDGESLKKLRAKVKDIDPDRITFIGKDYVSARRFALVVKSMVLFEIDKALESPITTEEGTKV